jgi:hypothetical protein
MQRGDRPVDDAARGEHELPHDGDADERREGRQEEDEAEDVASPRQAADPHRHRHREHQVQHEILDREEDGDAEDLPEDRVHREETNVVCNADETGFADHLPVGETEQERGEQRKYQKREQAEKARQQEQCGDPEVAPPTSRTRHPEPGSRYWVASC